MNRETVSEKVLNEKKEILYCIFSKENILDLPENSGFKENYINLQLDGKNKKESYLEFKDSYGISLDNYSNYGSLAGLYWLWKNRKDSYMGFSLTDSILDVSDDELKQFLDSNNDILVIKPQLCNCSLQENYRTLYFGYDFRMMLSILKRNSPNYYSFAKEKVIYEHSFIEPACVMKRDVLRKFCAWLFPILQACEEHIVDKYCKYQNKYLEHLSYYLFMIYIKYNEKKFKIQYVDSLTKLIQEKTESPVMNFENIKGYIQYLMNNREVETAYQHLKENKEVEEAKELLSLFEQYEKERRYYKTTLFEASHDLEQLSDNYKQKTGIKKCGRKVLIFEWASITHKESVLAFETLGFECHTYKTPYKSWVYDEDFLEQMNRHLDFNTFDLVFSVNYFAMIAEACYIHGIPYISWCYDSPTYIGEHRYLKYKTNHVFMFDSIEVERYRTMGFQNVHHMSLAVNVSRLDKIICTPEEIKKYKASISFVGALYDTKLTKALNYLTDYQKGYLNALVDNQSKVYGYNLFTPVLSMKFMEWISHPKFNKLVQSEWEKDQPDAKVLSPGSLNLLLNKMVTNRERLLLITMLSKHWDFKLYSNSTNEVFQNTIQCGTVGYYQEMPKVFKNSKINLNVTLRSIEAGIPQRCIDIMGSHGLLLTNYQKDLEEYFKDQENLLIYQSAQEAYEKVKFYLEHEDLRQKIENKGYETVKNYFNYPEVLKRMMKIAKLEYLL